MLTLTLQDIDCSGIIVTSDTVDWTDDVNIESVKIDVHVNCCDTGTTYTATDLTTPDDIFVDNGPVREIHIDPSFFGLNDTELNDGVYKVTVTTTDTVGSITEEVRCIFVDCYLKCKIVELIAKKDFEAHRIFEGIHKANECTGTDCDCQTACSLLKLLLDKLTILNYNTNAIADCGCS